MEVVAVHHFSLSCLSTPYRRYHFGVPVMAIAKQVVNTWQSGGTVRSWVYVLPDYKIASDNHSDPEKAFLEMQENFDLAFRSLVEEPLRDSRRKNNTGYGAIEFIRRARHDIAEVEDFRLRKRFSIAGYEIAETPLSPAEAFTLPIPPEEGGHDYSKGRYCSYECGGYYAGEVFWSVGDRVDPLGMCPENPQRIGLCLPCEAYP